MLPSHKLALSTLKDTFHELHKSRNIMFNDLATKKVVTNELFIKLETTYLLFHGI